MSTAGMFRKLGLAQVSKPSMQPSLLIIALLSIIAAHNGCSTKFTYPELTMLDEIVVVDRNQPIKTIKEKHQLVGIVKFINKHREGWSTPVTGFPITKVKLYFYREGKFQGSFGIDRSLFSMQREGRYNSKQATEQDVQELLDLVGIEKKLLNWR